MFIMHSSRVCQSLSDGDPGEGQERVSEEIRAVVAVKSCEIVERDAGRAVFRGSDVRCQGRRNVETHSRLGSCSGKVSCSAGTSVLGC